MINLRLEAASDVQECLATLRSLTSRRTKAQRRAMPLRPGAFPFRAKRIFLPSNWQRISACQLARRGNLSGTCMAAD